MAGYSSFTRQFPIKKTLRFELIPVGQTAENLRRSGFLEDDETRAREYPKVKKLVDEFHRRFINETLANSPAYDWQVLAAAHEERKSYNDLKSIDNLESVASAFRRRIYTQFTDEKNNPILKEYGISFKDLFSEKIFSKILKIDAEKNGIEENRRALKTFEKFSGYFLGLHECRRSFYAPKKQITSSISRIIDVNFPKFFNNCRKFEKLREEHPEVIDDLKASIGKDPDPYFKVENYGRFLSQDGIMEYNDVIAGHQSEGLEKKTQGFNEILNLKHLKEPGFELQMARLYNQVLGDTGESYSYCPPQFENAEQLIAAMRDEISLIDGEGALGKIADLLKHLEDYDASGIFIPRKELSSFSVMAFGRWDRAGALLMAWYADKLGDPTMQKYAAKVGKWLKSSEFSLKDIEDAAAFAGIRPDFSSIAERFDAIMKEASANLSRIDGLSGKRIAGSDEDAKTVKSILDPYIDAIRIARVFRADEDLPRDERFYSGFDQPYQTLCGTNPLYNKARNFCTRKPYSRKKFRLNFGNPTLANGWSVTIEHKDTAVILRDGNDYYLGIMDPASRTDFAKLGCRAGDAHYEKMNYMFLPDPRKLLPKVFIRPKNGFAPCPASEYITEGFIAGRHKPGENFDQKFCRDLIDYYKEAISLNPKWPVFDFRFRPTDEYDGIDQFYDDVARQGYSIRFVPVSRQKVDGLVKDGRLFLFRIHNKDFSPGSKGMPNIHTLYFRAAFSDKNLESPVIKLNGSAVIFFRKKTEGLEKVTHKKGSVLVNRTYRDTDGSIRSIPDSVYYELFRYRTGQVRDISPEARKYLNLAQCKTADRELVKDRRYLEDRMFFHVPFTFNFGASDPVSLNRKVIDEIRSDRDLRIIGIDRGERNLLYYVMTDRSGRIIEQRSLNEICHVDYHEKLVQREGDRAAAQQNWTKIGKITDLKDGYLSQVVSFLAGKVVREHAIIVLEDLNYGFKRGRYRVERQVYQKFENMLISKLAHLVLKDVKDPLSPGGALNAYQLARPPESVKTNQRQNGVIFYVPAAYTSKIDPTTGFVNLFGPEPDTVRGRKEFIERLNSIRYDRTEDCFAFEFDYRKYAVEKDSRNVWEAYTRGERITYRRKERRYVKERPTDVMKKALGECGISLDGDLKTAIASSDKAAKATVHALWLTLRLRNENESEDYIVSPIRNSDGEFFCTKNAGKLLPGDSDANGAYNIALKGELMLRMLSETDSKEDRIPKIPYVDNISWLTFVQCNKEYVGADTDFQLNEQRQE